MLRHARTGVAMAIALWLVACAGGSGPQESQQAGSFQLTYCATAADCGGDDVCLPADCDENCVPDASGQCLSCSSGARGICVPAPQTSEPGEREGGEDANSGAIGDCFAHRLGDPNVCDRQVDWAVHAIQTCADRGAFLVDYHAMLTCPGAWPSGAVLTCCFWEGEPEPPPPPPGECIEMPFPAEPDAAGNPDPKDMASRLCQDMGMELRDLYPLDGREDGQVGTWMAVCCPGDGLPPEPPPPPPVPETCYQELVGDGHCPADPNVDLKMMAWERCQERGGELRDLIVRRLCEDGTFGALVATCCVPGEVEPPPPPEPPPPECQEHVVPADPAIDPRELAQRLCDQQNLLLADVYPMVLDDGTIRAWIVRCCPSL